jgi:hypothetical protein
MDKPSERKKDSKAWGDTDVNTCRDFDAGGKREQLAGLWSIPSKDVVGLGPERLMTNDYCKEKEGAKDKGKKLDIADEVMTHGPPLLDISHSGRVF